MDHIYVLLFASALAVAGTYIIWGPTQSLRRKRKDTVPGLLNLGNSCFLNAVLQALAVCSSFIDGLINVTSSITKEHGHNCDLTLALLSLLKDLNKNNILCSPTKVIDALRGQRWVISNEEQDAHELFHVLTATLEEELMAVPSVLSLLEVSKLEKTCSDLQIHSPKKFFLSTSSTEKVKQALPTRGLLANQLTCKQCGYKYPVKYDTFDSVSLVISAPHSGQLWLQDCLQKFVSCELVRDVTCNVCSEQHEAPSKNTPKPKTTFIKQLSFGKLPECLCFHLQRTVWLNNGQPVKCFDHVAFPEVLCMDDYMYNSSKTNVKDGNNHSWSRLTGGCTLKLDNPQSKQNNSVHFQTFLLNSFQKQETFIPSEERFHTSDHLYLLKSVIVHLGDIFSGHFVTFRRGSVDNHSQQKWFCTSDSEIKEVPFSEVLQACAYMTFYERVPQ